jgi:hypothetical protein
MRNSIHASCLPVLAIAVAACCAVPTAAMRLPRIELLKQVQVEGATVLLSDLLPESADASLQARAREISLGAAPQPGHTRVLGRDVVLEEIVASGGVAEPVSVPEQIVISRGARAITTTEVLAAIQNAMQDSKIPMAIPLHPEDILLESQVLVGPGEAGLEVLRADFDRAMKRGRFLLWASKNPSVLPFFVAVRFAEGSPAAALAAVKEKSRNVSGRVLQPAAVQRTKPEFLVSPGEPATLFLHSAAVQMVADVMPLERGTMGQRVHVRAVDTGKIFTAQVDGHKRLELNF